MINNTQYNNSQSLFKQAHSNCPSSEYINISNIAEITVINDKLIEILNKNDIGNSICNTESIDTYLNMSCNGNTSCC